MFFFNRNTIQYPEDNIPYEEQVGKFKEKIQNAEAIVLGAGAGLSTAAGLSYSGERFQKYFFDFEKNIPFEISIPGASFPLKVLRNFGLGGVVVFTLIDTLMPHRMFMEISKRLWKEKTTLS